MYRKLSIVVAICSFDAFSTDIIDPTIVPTKLNDSSQSLVKTLNSNDFTSNNSSFLSISHEIPIKANEATETRYTADADADEYNYPEDRGLTLRLHLGFVPSYTYVHAPELTYAPYIEMMTTEKMPSGRSINSNRRNLATSSLRGNWDRLKYANYKIKSFRREDGIFSVNIFQYFRGDTVTQGPVPIPFTYEYQQEVLAIQEADAAEAAAALEAATLTTAASNSTSEIVSTLVPEGVSYNMSNSNNETLFNSQTAISTDTLSNLGNEKNSSSAETFSEATEIKDGNKRRLAGIGYYSYLTSLKNWYQGVKTNVQHNQVVRDYLDQLEGVQKAEEKASKKEETALKTEAREAGKLLRHREKAMENGEALVADNVNLSDGGGATLILQSGQTSVNGLQLLNGANLSASVYYGVSVEYANVDSITQNINTATSAPTNCKFTGAGWICK